MELEEFAFQLKKTGVKTVPFVVKVPSTANIMKAKQLIQEELNKFKHPQYGEVVLHLLNDSGLALYPFDNAHEEFHGRGKTEDKVIYFADSDKTLAEPVTPESLLFAHIVCAENPETKKLHHVSYSFALTCKSQRMLITAFADLFGKKSIDTIDTNRQLFVVPRFHSDEKSKQAAIPVRIHLVSDEKKWVVLLVDPSFDPSFKFKNTIKLRGPTENDEIKYLSLVYFSVGQRIGRNQAEWMIPKATEYLRISCHEKNYIYISDPPGRTVGVLLIDQNEKAVAIQTGHEGFNQSDDIKEHDWEFNYPPFMAYPLESEVIYTDQQLINVLNQSN